MARDHCGLVRAFALAAAVLSITAAVFAIAVLQRNSSVDAVFKPMIVHSRTVYGYVGETTTLPSDAGVIGEVSHSLGDSRKRVYADDAELSSNSYESGVTIYGDGSSLYVPSRDRYDVLTPLDDD